MLWRDKEGGQRVVGRKVEGWDAQEGGAGPVEVETKVDPTCYPPQNKPTPPWTSNLPYHLSFP